MPNSNKAIIGFHFTQARLTKELESVAYKGSQIRAEWNEYAQQYLDKKIPLIDYTQHMDWLYRRYTKTYA